MQNPAFYFRDHPCLRAVIDACLEGRAGHIMSTGEHPVALRLDVGCYSILGGDPDSEDALSLVKGSGLARELVYSGSTWKHLIQAVFPNAEDRSMMTFIPGDHAREWASRHRGDVSPNVHIAPLTPESPAHGSLTPHGFQVHETPEAFFRHGFGFFIGHEGRMVALATTYTAARDKAEISISTDPRYRNQGFATSLAGTMVLECFRRGLTPHWSASNPVSQRIARRVGFVENGVCHVLESRGPNHG
ncbi:GNAT family N-acetyltransferase [Sulfidibacter corallicola]|uniref:GNAT family N-acetyltransferase n=1 Tax=Sulfidibacter corallicola TaxID=2818388 RepID=A0A8A4TG56_SULCO|nr:GNAT family N-acetyltransferase [Sulfidibacter corallicola]QTD48906.1 GNAT family N-acetyltransferase [Sulfidibacter corallicola]